MKSTNPRKIRSEQLNDRIHQAARYVYAQQGNAWTVREVAELAQTAPANVMFHAGRMTELEDAIIDQALKEPFDICNIKILLRHYLATEENGRVSRAMFLALVERYTQRKETHV